MIYSALLLTLLSAALLRHTTPSPTIRLLLSVVWLLSLAFSGLYILADQLSGNGINESVLYHLQTDTTGAGIADFSSLLVGSVLYALSAVTLAAVIYRATYVAKATFNTRFRTGLALAGLGIAVLVNPGTQDIYQLLRSVYTQPQNLERPEKLIVPTSGYTLSKPRNIVFIYLESLEQTYLDRQLFPNLTPNLKQLLPQSLSFTDIRQTYGSSWTIAGMVSSQCGVPLVTPEASANTMSGADQFLPEALCLGDILAKQGYTLDFMGGADLAFAGKGKFYKTHGFTGVDGLKELLPQIPDPDYQNSWGLYDDDLYALLKSRFETLAKQDSPFGLFALTLDTHHPKGHLSASCSGKRYGDGKNPILNAVHCADTLVGDFVRYVRSHKAYSDTLIVIASDHLAFPNTATALLEKGNRRNLLLVLGENIPAQVINRPGIQLDITPTLLNLMGGNVTGLGFGRDLLGESPVLTETHRYIYTFLESYRPYLASLWNFPQLDAGLKAQPGNRTFTLQGRELRYPALIMVDDNLAVTDILFASDNKQVLRDQVHELRADQAFIWLDHCNTVNPLLSRAERQDEELDCVVAGVPGATDLMIQGFNSPLDLAFGPLSDALDPFWLSGEVWEGRQQRLQSYNETGVLDAISVDLEPHFRDRMLIRSAGGLQQGASFIKSHLAQQGQKLTRGLSLIGLNPGEEPESIRHIDLCDKSGPALPHPSYGFQEDIEQLEQSFSAFTIVSHDSARCDARGFDGLFAGTGLTTWEAIGVRMPYVAIISQSGDRLEYIGARETTLAVVINGQKQQ